MQPLGLTLQKKTSPITLKSMLAAGWLLVSGLFLMPHSLNGQEVAGAPEHYQTRPSPHFKPNKGQVADHEGNLIKAYKYVYQAPGMKVGLTQNGFHYNLYTVEEKAKPDKKVSEATGKPVNGEQQKPEMLGDEEAEKQTTYHYHRVEVAFKGANEDPDIIAGKQLDYYANYYLGYLPEYVTQVHGYRKLTYRNLYDSIDLVLRPATAEKGRPKLKYNIRVRPGGDLSDVKMVYKGMDKLSLEDGKLQIATSQGRMTETIPKSYWAESKEATVVNYQLEGNTVSFQGSGEEQKGQTLIVDPFLEWSTYLGGSGQDFGGKQIVADGKGNVYVGGQAGSRNFPGISGTHQTTYGGGLRDNFISKFTSQGSLSWSTYLGGSSFENCRGLTLNNNGDIYVTGFTESSFDFPTTPGAYQTSSSGGRDAFLSKFNSQGGLSWSTYLGGSSNDLGNGLVTNGSGNVYITGQSSSNNFPTTSGAFQLSSNGGQDAFISKFTGSGSLQWSTYLGGVSAEGGQDLALDGSGHIYLSGRTSSTNFPTTNGAYQPSYGGGSRDAFLCKFTISGSLTWSTFLGGQSKERSGQGVATDGSGNVYIGGGTQSATFPTTSNAYQPSKSGGRDGYIAKFTGSGSLTWSTFFGGSRTEGHQIVTDDNGNIYIGGTTQSTNLPTTNNAYQPSYGGGSHDGYISRFSTSGRLLYSTYLGGSGEDRGAGIAIGDNGCIYRSGYTASSDFPTSNASQGSRRGSKDASVTKFEFTPNAGFTSDSGCAGKTLSFVDTSSQQGSDTINQYDWNFGDGSSDSGRSVSHTYSSAGNYTVELIVTTVNGLKDTATEKAKVYPTPKASFTVNDSAQCQRNNSFQFTDQSTISAGSLAGYKWSFGDGASSQRQNPSHQYSSADSFTVSLSVTSDQGCEDTASQPVTVNPTPTSDFTINKVNYETVSFEATDTTLTNYQWKFGDGDVGVVAKPTKVYDTNGIYDVRLVTTNDNGCRDTTVKQVTMANTGVNLTQERTGISFQAYPNPFSEDIAVSYKLPTAQKDVQLLIVDQAGSTIGKHVYGRQSAGKHTYQLHALQEASPGTYFIRLKLGGDKQQVERVVKVE